jgi:hypothetical protein
MKNLKLNLCVLVLASMLYVLTPNVLAQQGDYTPGGGGHHITSVEK